MKFTKDLVIHFDKPTKLYSPGQEVTGKVIFNCPNEKKVRGLKIKILGSVKTCWVEATPSEPYQDSRTYSEFVVLFEYSHFAFGNYETNQETIIPQGTHTYPFQCTLPPQLPSSFESLFGQVQYEVIATLIKKHVFHYTKSNFIVNSIVDLNITNGATDPIRIRREIPISCFWCQNGSVFFEISLPKRGFVPGEYIPVKCEITNNSSKSLNGIELNLCQTVIYYAQGKRKILPKKILDKIKRGGFGVGIKSEIWDCNLIKIPKVFPTGLGNCRLIDVQYHLQVIIKLSGSHKIKADIPIIIGTIPLRAHQKVPETPF